VLEKGWTGQQRLEQSDMVLRFLTLCALTGLLALVAMADAGARLVMQKAQGAHRLCYYENRGTDRARVPTHQSRVGLGEPCPPYYRAEQSQVAQTIPSMATLHDEVDAPGGRLCHYLYMGTTYSRPIRGSAHCPLTPHFFDNDIGN
jgi:hypothetical protein